MPVYVKCRDDALHVPAIREYGGSTAACSWVMRKLRDDIAKRGGAPLPAEFLKWKRALFGRSLFYIRYGVEQYEA